MKPSALGFLMLAIIPAPTKALGQDLIGSWKQTAFYQKVVSTGERRFPFGEKIVGRFVSTREGTFCSMATSFDRQQGVGAPSDEERVGLFKTMYAYCGSYRVEGPKIIMQPDIAWAPNFTKQEQTRSWQIDGNILTMESSPFKSQLDGVDVVSTVIYQRE
jgi:hypothetical protein